MGHRGQGGWGPGRGREGKGKGRGKGGGKTQQPGVQAERCIPPGIQQMPSHHAHHHHPLPIYIIDPDLGALIPPPGPPSSPANRSPAYTATPRRPPPPPAVREAPAEPARTAAALLAQEPRTEPALGAVGAPHHAEARSDWVPDWSAVPDPLGGETPPLVLEVYGWLNWATSGTTRGLRIWRSDAVLLPGDGGNQEVTPGGVGDPGGRFAQDGPTRSRGARLSLRGGRCSASWTRKPMSGCQESCVLPLATGATAQGTRQRRSPSAHTSGGGGDGGTHGQLRRRPGGLTAARRESGPTPGRSPPAGHAPLRLGTPLPSRPRATTFWREA